MATVVLTDEQVVALVLQLPPESKRLILEALQAESNALSGPEIVEKEGLLVVRAPLLQDLSDIVEQEREARITTLLENFRSAIARVFRSWEEYPSAISKFRIVGVMDTTHDRYTLTHVDCEGERYKSHLLAQLEIQNGKIWILTDNTEEGVASELVSEGVPKDRIVLGFYSPQMRELGEFAVK